LSPTPNHLTPQIDAALPLPALLPMTCAAPEILELSLERKKREVAQARVGRDEYEGDVGGTASRT
jgi:hypothetical protein